MQVRNNLFDFKFEPEVVRLKNLMWVCNVKCQICCCYLSAGGMENLKPQPTANTTLVEARVCVVHSCMFGIYANTSVLKLTFEWNMCNG